MTIKPNSVVTLHYTVSTDDGTELDSSFGQDPLVFLQGSGFLIPGLDEALIGKTTGEKFSLDVEADKAYGERFDQLVQDVPKDMFEGMDVEVGMSFRATTDQGEQSVIIIDINDEAVIVDGNHPLAGMDLSFDVEIIEVRDATADEIEHGHVHSTQSNH